MNAETKQCQNCQQDFDIFPEDKKFYEKISVPAPTFCWLCRAQRRFAFRNERNLYKYKSDFSGKEIFSMYAHDAGVKVYEKDVWLSDSWEPMEYGRDVDFSKPFLEQIRELWYAVPLKNLNVVQGVRSDYCNHFTNPKNCYLVFNGNECEDCMYGNGLTYSKDSVDVSHLGKCERCYEGFWLTSCASTIFSSHCENSFNLAFCKNCRGCNDCFGSVGLRNKSYYISNKPYSKEEYMKTLKSFNLGSYQNLEKIKEKTREFWLKFPNKYIEGSHNQKVSGNYINHSKNVLNSFLVREGENLRYCQYVQELPASRDCYDYSIWGDSNELVYECCACGIGTNNIKFCLFVQENVNDIEYSIACSSSRNLFGSVGLRKKEYCILNKQYSKESYKTFAAKKKHMEEMPYVDKKGRVYRYGEFFPVEFSPWRYNETIAFDYFPLTKDKALQKGYRWKDREMRERTIIIMHDKLPDHINDVADSITDEIVGCVHEGKCNENCTSAFRIIPQELAFYKKMSLPLPHLCPTCRFSQRLRQRTPLAIQTRLCQCAGEKSDNSAYKNTSSHFHKNEHCPNEFETSYAPDRPKTIYLSLIHI